MTDSIFYDANDLLNGSGEYQFPLYRDLAGSRVFITGGGSGIGAYFVVAFALQDAEVGFVEISEEPANYLCDGISKLCGKRPKFYPGDVRDLDMLNAAIKDFQTNGKAVDVLINNAARDMRHTVTSYGPKEWDDMMHVNLRPHYFTTQYVVRGMKEKGGGSIINVGSNAANLGLAGYPAYVASKAGIVGLTKALARELGPDNIRVNALIPGWVMTKRQQKLWATPETLKTCLDQQSLKSTIRGEDVAQSALFLASAASTMMTGQSLIVDAGRV